MSQCCRRVLLLRVPEWWRWVSDEACAVMGEFAHVSGTYSAGVVALLLLP